MSYPSTRPARPGGPGDDRGFTLFVGALAAVLALSGLLWAAGQLSGLITGAGWPASTAGQAPTIAAGVLARHPGNPAAAWPQAARSTVAGPGWVWGLAAVLLAAATVAGYAALHGWRRVAGGRDRGPGRRPGMASGSDVGRHLSARAVQARAGAVRPSLSGSRRPAPHLVALRLGRDALTRQPVWGSVEDSYIVLGPPRAGKGVHLVIPLTLDAPGAAIVTSTRPDVLRATWAARGEHGPAALFDPQDLSGQGNSLRWSPVRGCAEPLTAILRARALVAGAKLDAGNVTGGDFWKSTAEAVVRCYLHAAALGGRGVTEVLRWVANPADTAPVELLRRSTDAAAGWAEELAAQADADTRHRDNVWAGVRRAFDCLADPRVLAACSPGAGEDFDPDAFLDGDGTLYLLGSAAAQLSVAPLITALVEDVVEAARRRAARAPGGPAGPAAGADAGRGSQHRPAAVAARAAVRRRRHRADHSGGAAVPGPGPGPLGRRTGPRDVGRRHGQGGTRRPGRHRRPRGHLPPGGGVRPDHHQPYQFDDGRVALDQPAPRPGPARGGAADPAVRLGAAAAPNPAPAPAEDDPMVETPRRQADHRRHRGRRSRRPGRVRRLLTAAALLGRAVVAQRLCGCDDSGFR